MIDKLWHGLSLVHPLVSHCTALAQFNYFNWFFIYLFVCFFALLFFFAYFGFVASLGEP